MAQQTPKRMPFMQTPRTEPREAMHSAWNMHVPLADADEDEVVEHGDRGGLS